MRGAVGRRWKVTEPGLDIRRRSVRVRRGSRRAFAAAAAGAGQSAAHGRARHGQPAPARGHRIRHPRRAARAALSAACARLRPGRAEPGGTALLPGLAARGALRARPAGSPLRCRAPGWSGSGSRAGAGAVCRLGAAQRRAPRFPPAQAVVWPRHGGSAGYCRRLDEL
ncbi:uncharacterized protein LOC121338270 [Onychostruthus taczanowskii]|uniref:uncharacterized protein LOC121338270 n=1 Tax=Onychostruthus taczanowskii TaxID=356909 RepID=UPI001B80C4FD|nr:uncharacterized protein LOC121338270 [Onychostruthus taczanowskii]